MHAQHSRVRSRRAVAIGVAALAAVGMIGGATSLALFTDQQSVNSAFTSGTIKLDGAQIAGLTLNAGAFMPGSTVTDDVVVENTGTAQLRYAISQISTDDASPNGPALYGALDLTVKTVDATTPGTPCDDFDGTQLFTGTISAAGNVVGNPAQGSNGGDRVLDAGTNETLCFQVALPFGTGNAYQGATSTTTFAFSAEQTANN